MSSRFISFNHILSTILQIQQTQNLWAHTSSNIEDVKIQTVESEGKRKIFLLMKKEKEE